MKKTQFFIGLITVMTGIFFLPVPTVYASGLSLQEEYVAEIPPNQLYRPTTHLKGAAVYHSEWDKYSCSYVYNQLSDKEKLLWDAFDGMCLEYLTSDRDLGSYTEYVPTDLSTREIYNVAYLFIYSKPQYYFIDSALSYSGGSNRGVAFLVYKEFQPGAKRAEYTRQVKAAVDEIVSQAAMFPDKTDQLRIVHDAIVGRVEYNTIVYEDDILDQNEEEIYFTQSAYSALCLDYTVCAGYAKAFEMVCNALDIDCIAITSAIHAWNKVRINDSWYNVDCTWDDLNGEICYDCYARSDDNLTGAEHIPDRSYPNWQGIAPPATLDTGSTLAAPGTFPTITDATSAPVFTAVTAADGTVNITLSCDTPRSDIYYTLDGSLPSQAATKSYKYRGSFTAGSAETIRAIAVCDTCLDSEVVDYQVPVVLSVPKLKTPVNTASAVTVKWEPAANADGYLIYRKTKGGKYEELAVVEGGASASYKDTDVINGTRYTYTVKAYKGDRTSDWTKVGVTIVRLLRPSLSSAKASGQKLTVKWSPNSKATGYQISYTTGSTKKTITVAGSANRSIVIDSLKKGETYKLQIRNYKNVGGTTCYSAWSTTKSIKL